MIVLLDDNHWLVVVVVVVMDDDHRLMVMIDLLWRFGICGGHETKRRQRGNGQDDSSHDMLSHSGKDGQHISFRAKRTSTIF
jgi:hypothetical protein